MKTAKWKVNTPQLLQEIATNNTVSILKVPLNIFQSLLSCVAKESIRVDDKEFNKLMIRLALYDNCTPNKTKEYKQNMEYLES